MTIKLDDYAHRVKPFAHQAEALALSYNKRSFALFMDPGTGKTKVVIDTAALMFLAGYIRGMLVVAPNDVHEQWVVEQLPIHLPTDIKLRAIAWDGQRQSVLRKLDELLKPLPNRLHVLTMNCEALATKKGQQYARKFLTTYPSLFVLDESHDYANPKAARTKGVLDVRHLAFARRIMSGTPMDGDPFDLYAQFQFLDPRILKQDSFLAFKHRYGIFTKEWVLIPGQFDEHGNPKRRHYESLQEYQRLDELFTRVRPVTYQKRKADCRDMPPVLRSTLLTHLSDAQRSIHDMITEQGLLLLRDVEAGRPVQAWWLDELDEDEAADRMVDANNRLTMKIKLSMLLRQMQCVAGFVSDDAKVTRLIDGKWDKCPRMIATIERVKQALDSDPGKVIVWAHFRPALELLNKAFAETWGRDRVTMIHGGVTGAVRAEAIDRFKRGRLPRVLVAHPKTMGVGQNLGMATTAIFYTNGYSWIQRRQAEDRIDRIDRVGTCSLVDVVARGSNVDRMMLQAHKEKGDFMGKFAKMSAEQLRESLDADPDA